MNYIKMIRWLLNQQVSNSVGMIRYNIGDGDLTRTQLKERLILNKIALRKVLYGGKREQTKSKSQRNSQRAN